MPKITKRPAREPCQRAPDTLELRRWCVEQAIRWPVEYGNSGYVGVSSMPRPPQEADVIGRATRLLNWVTAK